MKMLKLYLDICSHNRPFDDQMQMRIRLETEAKLYIQAGIRDKKYLLAWSFMLDYENDKNPYERKRNYIELWKEIADDFCPPSEIIRSRSREIMALNVKQNDALHIACAIEQKCDYFITTDKGLTNKNIEGIIIINPIDFILETEELI